MRVTRLIALCMLLGALTARADDAADAKAQARRDVDAGLAAQAAGHYDDAIKLYKRAYVAIPHPEILFDLAQASPLKGDLDAAVDYYKRYLAAEPAGRGASDAQRWIADLGKRIADRKAEARKADAARKAEAAREAEAARQAEA